MDVCDEIIFPAADPREAEQDNPTFEAEFPDDDDDRIDEYGGGETAVQITLQSPQISFGILFFPRDVHFSILLLRLSSADAPRAQDLPVRIAASVGFRTVCSGGMSDVWMEHPARGRGEEI